MQSRLSIVFQLFMLFTPLSIWQCEQMPTVKAASVVIDKNPEFKGGQIALFKYLSANVKYPLPLLINNGIEGTVYVKFIVETDGQLTHIEVLRGIDVSCNEEALRVVKSMSSMWESGLNQGIKVRMPFTLPVKFNLE